ncbi:MFS general substrate transporter [Coprinellus micaceus]|uniref:MFS general substrate transporter n=1 Tax=Coprinellus micaceus TaxID=71717 RepID=A0A4Y7T9H0_COPMI|nr:MFS general substrate transporter [Coprinellus micaceus]
MGSDGTPLPCFYTLDVSLSLCLRRIPQTHPPRRARLSAHDDFNTPEDKRLVRKIDFRLIPILTLLYLLSFLDRSNIGNAKIIGLVTDLKMDPAHYNTALALYFVSYVIFEVPANNHLLKLDPVYTSLKRFDPQIWLPTLTFLWGTVTIGQGFVKNQAGLLGIRFLLGMAEAGLFPGVIYVFSVYYRRHERSWRVAIFFGGAALAGAFGGILAYAIGKMDGVSGLRGWAWIFILEGILTVAVSLFAYFVVPTWSHKAKFLTPEEKARLLQRLDTDSDAALIEKFQWKYVKQALLDHLVWGYAALFHGFAFVLYSLIRLPLRFAIFIFLNGKNNAVLRLTIPPNALASISIWTTVWISSKVDRRAPFIIGSAGLAILGYIILLTTKTPGAQYVGVHFAAAGVYTGNALLLSWPGENVSAQTKRAVAVAMQITIGDIGAIAGVLIYRPSLNANHFRIPHIISIGYLLFAILVTLYLATWMGRENKRRDEVLASSKVEIPISSPLERQEQGDREIRYRYVI